MQFVPKDEWGQRANLITSYEIKNVDDISKIISKEIPLGYFNDDLLITITSKQLSLCVVTLFQMYERTGDKGVYNLMMWMLSSTIADIKISRSKGGREMYLQHGAVTGQMQQELNKDGGMRLPRNNPNQEGMIYNE